MRLSRLVASVTCLLLSACAPDLREDYPFDGAVPSDGESRVTFEPNGDGTTTSRVDATRKEIFVYVDLDDAREIPGTEAVGTGEWDLAFQRFKIISNSGVSGVGGVEVAVLPGQDFGALTHAPSAGYQHDAPDGPDGNSDVDSAFLVDDGWYVYDLSVHKVAPRNNVYVVHTARGFYKLKLLAYYDQAGTGAKVSFQWGPVAAP
jgi:hypothetical protein